MYQSLKQFYCPSCNFCFSNREGSRLHGVTRFPLVLSCQHTVCENCIKNSLKIQHRVVCSVCQVVTTMDDGDTSKLVPDVYVLGIVSANCKQGSANFKIKVSPPKALLTNGSQFIPKETVVMCDHCSSVEASFRCEKCDENFCNVCFDSFHKSRNKNFGKHTAVPIYAHPYSEEVQRGCLVHNNHAIEFHCEEDQQLICSLCVVTGDHRGHAVMTLVDKNKACAGDLRTVKEAATIVSKRLKHAEQKLSQAIPCEKIDNTELVKQIHDHFHHLHTVLCLREIELITQMESISELTMSQMEKIRQDVSHSSRDLDAILRDAEFALENPALSISVPSVIKKLESAQTMQCYLVPITSSDPEQPISVDFEESIKDILAKHGKISADIKPKFCLRSAEELPSDYIFEPMPVEVVPTCAESATSGTNSFSDDSLAASHSPNVPDIKVPTSFSFQTSKTEKVTVTHIRDPTDFYIIYCSQVRKLHSLLDKINKWCKTPASQKCVPDTVEEGDLYLVRYSFDDKWYRGRATEIISDQGKKPIVDESAGDGTTLVELKKDEEVKVKIFYSDFGNTEIVPLSKLRNIQTQFLNLPGMAKHCSLHDISPINQKFWTLAATTAFKDFVHDKEVNMQVMEERGNMLYVDLSQSASYNITNDVPVSVRDALVFLEHGCFISETNDVKLNRKRNVRQFFPPESIRANTKSTILVSHMENPSNFFIQQMGTSRYLTDLLLDMKNTYNENSEAPHYSIYVPYIGMMVAAQFKKDDFWYRAEVIGLPGGAKVEVRYVDFGNREVLNHRQLRKLLDRFTKLNIQAIQCSLADVTYLEGKGWSSEASSWLIKYVEKKHLTMLSLGMSAGSRTTKTVLYDPQDDGEICINALMVAKEYASSSGPQSLEVIKPYQAPKFVRKATLPQPSNFKVITSPRQKSPAKDIMPEPVSAPAPPAESLVPKEEPPNHVKVLMSYVESPSCFYVRIAHDFEEKFTKLMNKLQYVYNDSDGVPTVVDQGNCFACFRESDKKWYRGIVTQNISEDMVEVRFVDVGCLERIEHKNLRILIEQHSLDQAYAILCHIDDILPAGDTRKWSQFAIDIFEDLLKPHDVLYLTGDPVADASCPADLLYREVIRGGALEPSRIEFVSIRDKLIEEGVALRVRKKISTPVKPVSPSKSSQGSSSRSSPCSVILASPKKSCSISSPKSSVSLPRKLAFQWKQAELPKELKFTCRATHIGEDGCIYVQQKPEATSKVELITSALHCKYSTSAATHETLRIPPPIGEAVISKFLLDNKWYRAEIITNDPNKIKVQFVDFGNCEMVPLGDIRVDTVMQDTPKLSLECELYDTKPANGKKWPSNVLDFIHESVVDQECVVEILNTPAPGERLKVSLELAGAAMSISDLMKELGFAVSEEQYLERLLLENIVDETEDAKLLEMTYTKASDLKFMKPFKVCLTQILKPNMVCLQRLKVQNPETEDEIASNLEIEYFLVLMDELNSKAEDFQELRDFAPGVPCCAKYSFDNQWYRCEITKVLPDNTVEVFYVDYGNIETLPLNKLRKLEPPFLDFPLQLHICKLFSVQPAGEDWSVEAEKAFAKRITSNLEVYARIMVPADVLEVELLIKKDDEEFELLYDEIVSQGLVKLSAT